MDLIHHTFLSLRGISNGDDAIVHNDFASACVDAFFYATDYMFGRADNDRSGSFFISSVCARMLFTQVKRVPVFYPAVFEKKILLVVTNTSKLFVFNARALPGEHPMHSTTVFEDHHEKSIARIDRDVREKKRIRI